MPVGNPRMLSVAIADGLKNDHVRFSLSVSVNVS
jgi:hypothetical protein